MTNAINHTKEAIARAAATNARYARNLALSKWNGSEEHPLFQKAKSRILSSIESNADKQNEASIWFLRRFTEHAIDKAGNGLFHAALLALEREGKVELLRREAALPHPALQNPLAWFVPRKKRAASRDTDRSSTSPVAFNMVKLVSSTATTATTTTTTKAKTKTKKQKGNH